MSHRSKPASDASAPSRHDRPPGGWSWRSAGSSASGDAGLLYEPGQWGDVLKGIWTLLLVRSLAASGEPLLGLDPFAGARTYPLTAGGRARLAELGGGVYARAQAPWSRRGEVASAGQLALEAARATGARAALEVFDSEPGRLATWDGVPGTIRLDLTTGEEAFATRTGDWALCDPYDLFDRWPEILPPAARWARQAPLLLYLLNRAPRGGGHARSYRAFRRRLEELAPSPALVGRCPTDRWLPRAYHEVILLGPRPVPPGLERELVRTAKALTCKLATGGSTEWIVPAGETGSGKAPGSSG